MASVFTPTYPIVDQGHRSQLPPPDQSRTISSGYLDRQRPMLRRKPDRRAQPRVSPADVAMRAYELYEQRGRDHGHDMDDWLQAEQELRRTLDSTAAPDGLVA